RGGYVELTSHSLRRIERLRGVKQVIPVSAVGVGVVPPAADPHPEPFGTEVIGVDLRRIGQLPVTLLEGRLPDPDSLTEVAVTNAYLERVGHTREHPERALGAEVEIVTAAGWRYQGGGYANEPNNASWAIVPMFTRARI